MCLPICHRPGLAVPGFESPHFNNESKCIRLKAWMMTTESLKQLAWVRAKGQQENTYQPNIAVEGGKLHEANVQVCARQEAIERSYTNMKSFSPNHVS